MMNGADGGSVVVLLDRCRNITKEAQQQQQRAVQQIQNSHSQYFLLLWSNVLATLLKP
jgi:hypothetical protein